MDSEPGQCSHNSGSLRFGRQEERIPEGVGFSAPVQKGPGAHHAPHLASKLKKV
jgi:hypothetical protein